MTPLSWILFTLLYIELDHALGEVISKMKAVSINIYIYTCIYYINYHINISEKKIKGYFDDKIHLKIFIRYDVEYNSVFVVVYDDRAFVENSC